MLQVTWRLTLVARLGLLARFIYQDFRFRLGVEFAFLVYRLCSRYDFLQMPFNATAAWLGALSAAFSSVDTLLGKLILVFVLSKLLLLASPGRQ